MADAARIGVISDTHGRLRPGVLERLAGVEHILHAGDVGDDDVLIELEAVAPVTAVLGNVDGFELRGRLPEVARLELAGRSIVVVHGHQFGAPSPARLSAAYPDAHIVIFGHTHRPALERLDNRLFLNPGAAGPARFHLKPSIALLDLTAEGEAVRFIELS